MATKKKTASKKAATNVLGFKKEWIFDPGPEFFRINRAAVTRLNQMKDEFARRANEVIRQGQR